MFSNTFNPYRTARQPSVYLGNPVKPKIGFYSFMATGRIARAQTSKKVGKGHALRLICAAVFVGMVLSDRRECGRCW